MSPMTKIELPARLLRAAQPFRAASDPRTYLQGVIIHPAGYVAATNGHILFRAECDAARDLESAVLMRVNGTVPAKAETAHISLNQEEGAGYMWFSDSFFRALPRKGEKVFTAFSLLDAGSYPDIDRVLPKDGPVATESIGVNPEYIGQATKAAKALGIRHPVVEMRLRGASNCIELLLKSPGYNATIIIMPVRL